MPTGMSILSRDSTPTAADRLIRNQKQIAHVRQLWVFLGSVFLFFTLVNLIRRLSSRFTPISEHKGIPVEETNSEEGNKAQRLITSPAQRGLSALGTGFKIVFFRWSVPLDPGTTFSISELTFIIIYIISMLLWLLVDTRNLMDLMYQDRAALLASSQIPLIVALAGKNNVISWLTGVSHEKLNVLHRAAARTNFVLFWIHAGTRIHTGLSGTLDLTHNWMRSGALSLTALTLATILSVRFIRRRAFEFFLVTHVILILISIVSGYYHARDLHFGNYIWPGLLVWGFDRALRLGRIVLNGQYWKCQHSEDALVEILSDDTIRLTMRRQMSWIPGQHAYIILPTISTLPFEAHPFTIASIPDNTPAGSGSEVVFLIRSRGGFTQKILGYAVKNHQSRVPVFLDGPYGVPPDLRRFSTCILIAGGSGISYTLPLLLHLSRLSSKRGESSVRRIVFVWAIRDAKHLKWLSKAFMEALCSASSSLSVELRVFITGKKSPDTKIAITEDNKTSTTLFGSSESLVGTDNISQSDMNQWSSFLNPIYGRPDLKDLFIDEINASLGSVSVNVAGPSSLALSACHTLMSNIVGPVETFRGSPSVSLHIESFGS